MDRIATAALPAYISNINAPRQIVVAGNDAALGADGRTLYFATDRTVPMALPHSRAAAEQALADMQGWNNGNGNVWSVSLAPWLDAVRAGQPPPSCPSPAS